MQIIITKEYKPLGAALKQWYMGTGNYYTSFLAPWLGQFWGLFYIALKGTQLNWALIAHHSNMLINLTLN